MHIWPKIEALKKKKKVGQIKTSHWVYYKPGKGFADYTECIQEDLEEKVLI